MKIQTIIFQIIFCLCFAGCKEDNKEIQVNCKTSITIFNSFGVMLFDFDKNLKSISKVLSITPKNEIIGQAMFHCGSGKLIFNTEERMTSDSKGILHFHSMNSEKTMEFKEGINSFYPLQNDKLLVRTQLIRRGGLDKEIGDLSLYEGYRDIQEFNNSNNTEKPFNPENIEPSGQIYIDDILVDINNFERIKKIKGTFDPHYLQNDKFITYANDETVYDFNPYTGQRRRIHDYKNQWERLPGTRTPKSMQYGVQYYTYEANLYALNGKNKEAIQGKDTYDENSIFIFNKSQKYWERIATIGFNPQVTLINGSNIVAVGETRTSIFDIHGNKQSSFKIPISGYKWTSIGMLDGGWALTGMKLSVGDNKTESIETTLFIFPEDWSSVISKLSISGFQNPRISTYRTPISQRQVAM